MRASLLLLAASLLAAGRMPARGEDPPPKPRNVCVNGGFEEVRPFDGRDHPLRWLVQDAGEIGFAPISADAHSGKRAARLVAGPKAMSGMNQDCPGVVAGVVRFWYKAVRSTVKGQNLVFFMIPMRGDRGMAIGQEIDPRGQASGRTGCVIPAEDVGDGKWHQAEFEFDFTDLRAGHSVCAPRINEFTPATGEGELLLDDVEVLPAVK
jgi:hypothetical protein